MPTGIGPAKPFTTDLAQASASWPPLRPHAAAPTYTLWRRHTYTPWGSFKSNVVRNGTLTALEAARRHADMNAECGPEAAGLGALPYFVLSTTP